MLPRDHAILGIDLAQSRQAAVLADHDSRVIARWRPRCTTWGLGELLERALPKARAAGVAEPHQRGSRWRANRPGHRWMVLGQLAAEQAVPLVCVQPRTQPMWAEQLDRGKKDDRDAVLIARQAAQLHCYLPERASVGWARLRHFGARRCRGDP